MHHNAEGLYHETITTAWIRLLSTHHETEFGEFLAANEHRLTKEVTSLLDSRIAGER